RTGCGGGERGRAGRPRSQSECLPFERTSAAVPPARAFLGRMPRGDDMHGDYLDRLARLARRVRFDDLSDSTVAATKAVVLDTLGAILAGSRLGENQKLADLAIERSGNRSATIIGRARKADPMFAALANGTAGVALEVDEGNRWGGG